MLHDYQVEVANMALKEQRGIIKCATGKKILKCKRAPISSLAEIITFTYYTTL